MGVESFSPPPSGRFTVRINTRSSRVVVTAVDDDRVTVGAGSRSVVHVEEGDAVRPTAVEINSSSDAVDVECPAGTDVVVGTGSGKIDLEGRLGHVRVLTRSGTVRIDDVTSADVRTASGRVTIERCDGDCRVMSRSGSIAVGAAGSLDAAVKSGRLSVEQVGQARVYSGSGSIEIGTTGEGDLEIRVMSGSVRVGVPRGARPELRARARNGRVRCDCPEGHDFVVDVATQSGAVTVRES